MGEHDLPRKAETTAEVAIDAQASKPAPRDPPPEPEEDEKKGGRFARFARKFLEPRETLEDTKDLFTAVLSSSDRAKTEMVKMAAREARNYLDELRLKEAVMELATNYSLEVSISLKPIARAVGEAPPKKTEEGS